MKTFPRLDPFRSFPSGSDVRNAPNRSAVLFCFLAVLLAVTGTGAAGAEVVIVGSGSDNLVRVDLATGEWDELHRFDAGAGPRAVVAGIDGTIFASLSGAGRNVVKLIPTESEEYSEINFTRAIGNFGPGALVLDDRGLWVAGDTERRVLLFAEVRGQELRRIEGPPFNNLGLAVAGDDVYSTEYFQRSITHYDLRESPPETSRLVADSDKLDLPFAMVIGHTGNLFVVSRSKPTVVEFDIETGDFIRIFADLSRMRLTRLSGIAFDPVTMQYCVVEGDSVYVLDRDGQRLDRHTPPVLEGALGIDVVPSGEPVRRNLAIRGTVLQMEGVAGERYQIEASTDLAQWSPIAIVENLNGDFQFADPEASEFDQRFYRMRLVE